LEFADQTLVEEVQDGSSVAFEQLMHRYERLVFKVAYGYIGGREGALDVTQNVFLKVHSNLSAFRGKGSFKGWLMRITVNESLNYNRSQKRHQGHDEIQDGITQKFQALVVTQRLIVLLIQERPVR